MAPATETKDLQQFVQYIGSVFYSDDLLVCLLEALSRETKPVLDRELADKLRLPLTMVNAGMRELMKDLFVVSMERRFSKRYHADDGRVIERPDDVPSTYIFFAIDYKLLLDIVKYKVAMLSRESEETEKESKANAGFFCPRVLCADKANPGWNDVTLPKDRKQKVHYDLFCQTCLLEISQCQAEKGITAGTRHEHVDDLTAPSRYPDDLKVFMVTLFRHSRDLIRQCRHDAEDHHLSLGVNRMSVYHQLQNTLVADYEARGKAMPRFNALELSGLTIEALRRLRGVAKGGDLPEPELNQALRQGLTEAEVDARRKATAILIDAYRCFWGPPCKKYKSTEVQDLHDPNTGMLSCKLCKEPVATIQPTQDIVIRQRELGRVLGKVSERLRSFSDRVIPYWLWGLGLEAATSVEFRKRLAEELGIGVVAADEEADEDEERERERKRLEEEEEMEVEVKIDSGDSVQNPFSFVEVEGDEMTAMEAARERAFGDERKTADVEALMAAGATALRRPSRSLRQHGAMQKALMEQRREKRTAEAPKVEEEAEVAKEEVRTAEVMEVETTTTIKEEREAAPPTTAQPVVKEEKKEKEEEEEEEEWGESL